MRACLISFCKFSLKFTISRSSGQKQIWKSRKVFKCKDRSEAETLPIYLENEYWLHCKDVTLLHAMSYTSDSQPYHDRAPLGDLLCSLRTTYDLKINYFVHISI